VSPEAPKGSLREGGLFSSHGREPVVDGRGNPSVSFSFSSGSPGGAREQHFSRPAGAQKGWGQAGFFTTGFCLRQGFGGQVRPWLENNGGPPARTTRRGKKQDGGKWSKVQSLPAEASGKGGSKVQSRAGNACRRKCRVVSPQRATAGAVALPGSTQRAQRTAWTGERHRQTARLQRRVRRERRGRPSIGWNGERQSLQPRRAGIRRAENRNQNGVPRIPPIKFYVTGTPTAYAGTGRRRRSSASPPRASITKLAGSGVAPTP